ncbi:MAG: glycoside hydrolase domain-containing protein [Bacteroidota bacterium]
MRFLLALSLLFCLSPVKAQWTVATSPWLESYGSQRAVIEIAKTAEVAELKLLWRRHDPGPDQKRLLIISGETGDTIKNIRRLSVSQEECSILFGPVPRPGKYFFYYLPFEVQDGWGFYGRSYLKPEPAPETTWPGAGNTLNQGRIPKAKVLSIESRTAFDSFYPMEIIPTQAELDGFLLKCREPVLYFPESRELPIRMKDRIPLKWLRSGPSGQYTGKALRNEYYAFQIGVYAARQDIRELEVQFSLLTSPDHPDGLSIPMTCFNTEGTDPHGNAFIKKLDIPKGGVQALWIGADIPESIVPGNYEGFVMIRGKDLAPKQIKINIEIGSEVLPDRGDCETWRHSRLRWLNSTAGSDGDPIAPYQPIRAVKVNTFEVANHIISLNPWGLPGQIANSGDPVLGAPVKFYVVANNEVIGFPYEIRDRELKPGSYTQTTTGTNGNLKITYQVKLDYDGYMHCTATVDYLDSPDSPASMTVDDIRLDIPLIPERAKYMMGMGLPGCSVPMFHSSKWSGPYDSFWIGDAEGGIWCELRGSTYHGPLLNLYRPAPPPSWDNEGNGGFRILPENGNTVARVFSGPRTLRTGDRYVFEWSMLITPVKKIDTKSQFLNRYYHSGAQPTPGKSDFDAGVRIINVHHANKYNPYINYPFIAVKEMKSFIDSIHQFDKKVKIYYTVRELTNHVTEIWALRSLGYEILGNGSGGGYPWLREHFVDGYTPQWYQHFPDGEVDASILSAPGDSRWLNYYIEGLAWLVKNVGIDGLYLDDVSFDRTIIKRMRTVMSRLRPDCIIDLHSNTGFSKGPATQYAEFFPYVDKLWFGESFQYDKMSPENWLVETSGIPFGLMGDMLQGGGNRWLGMAFGMTVRHPWTTEGVLCDPRPVWKIWDEFKIEESRMTGFWEDDCPVKTDKPDVKATVYSQQGKSLISIGNFGDQNQNINLIINWKALGLNPDKCRMYAPAVENFQPARELQTGEEIPVEARKGWLIFLVTNEQ